MPDSFIAIRPKQASRFLAELDISSGTGPDLLPTRILKTMAKELGLPFAKLARLIIYWGIWPRTWKIHWIFPLFKKKSIFDPNNYRGIQLTAQLSKAMERLIGSCFLPRLISLNVFGKNQFAYRVAHGARDALLFLVCSWLQILADGGRIGLYCSDVSGAFDRVSASYLIDKLRRLSIHPGCKFWIVGCRKDMLQSLLVVNTLKALL